MRSMGHYDGASKFLLVDFSFVRSDHLLVKCVFNHSEL
jgi:hypothetical protein